MHQNSNVCLKLSAMAQLVKRGHFSFPPPAKIHPALPSMFSKSEALSDLLPISDKGFDEEKDEKTVWAEGAGGGVEEALVPQLHLKGGRV